MYYILILLLLSGLLHAEESTWKVQAVSVDYDTKKINLLQNVHIQHNFGILHCQKAVITLAPREPEKKKMEAEKIFMQNDVQIELKDGTLLYCDEGEIDCITLEGVFFAKEPRKVIYISFHEEDGKKIPIKTSSQAMKIKMKKNEGSYEIADFHGNDTVTIEFDTRK